MREQCLREIQDMGPASLPVPPRMRTRQSARRAVPRMLRRSNTAKVVRYTATPPSTSHASSNAPPLP
eukprot:9116560-Pyramimonas_sp.AAC.1